MHNLWNIFLLCRHGHWKAVIQRSQRMAYVYWHTWLTLCTHTYDIVPVSSYSMDLATDTISTPHKKTQCMFTHLGVCHYMIEKWFICMTQCTSTYIYQRSRLKRAQSKCLKTHVYNLCLGIIHGMALIFQVILPNYVTLLGKVRKFCQGMLAI